MNKPPKPTIYYRLNIEILQIVEERLSALPKGTPIDPATLASEIISDDLSKGFSWHELTEIIEAAAEELDVPMPRQPMRIAREQ